MFYGNKDEVKNTLRLMQKNVCAYDLGFFPEEKEIKCDCKYGYNPKQTYGERTGCPELRTVVKLLEKMTEQEYMDILQRE